MRKIQFIIILLLSNGFLNSTFANEISKVEQLELAFFYAVRNSKIDIVERFLDAGVDVDFQNNLGYSALMVAAFRGQNLMVDYLLKRKANTCLVDKRGNTALMAAIVSAEFSISRKLMSYDCNDENIEKRTLKFAEKFGQDKIADLLKLSKKQIVN